MKSKIEKGKLFVAIPCYTGNIKVPCMVSLIDNIRFLEKIGWKIDVNFQMGDANPAHARNDMINRFYYSDASDFIFIDDDLGFEPRAIHKLLSAPEEIQIAAGVYPYRNRLESSYHFRPMLDAGKPIFKGAFMKVKFCPGGFMRITRAALDAMMEIRHSTVSAAGEVKYQWYRTGQAFLDAGDSDDYGEDIFFCKDANRKGVGVWVFPDIDFQHTGTYTTDGNLLKYLEVENGDSKKQ